MDDKIRQAERKFLISGNKEDAIEYVMACRRIYGKTMPSSLEKKYPKICAIDNFICRDIYRDRAKFEVSYGHKNSPYSNYNQNQVKMISNFAFFDAIEFDEKIQRLSGGSPYLLATSIVDGDMYAVTTAYIMKLLKHFRNGILVSKFTFSHAGHVQSMVLEK